MFLAVARLTKSTYTLEIFANKLEGSTLVPYLIDTYLNSTTQLSTVDTNKIVFAVNATIPESSGRDRFKIVWKETASILPVSFTSIDATQKDKTVKVDWFVAQETNIKKYVVERSTDGTSFTSIGEVASKGNSVSQAYNLVDNAPARGVNYYRVRSIQIDGRASISKTVAIKTTADAANQRLTIFPNPIKGNQVNLQVSYLSRGEYSLVLYNTAGIQVFNKNIQHEGGALNSTVHLTKSLSPGIYYLNVSNKEETISEPVFID
jgi:hypothetical protein